MVGLVSAGPVVNVPVTGVNPIAVIAWLTIEVPSTTMETEQVVVPRLEACVVALYRVPGSNVGLNE